MYECTLFVFWPFPLPVVELKLSCEFFLPPTGQHLVLAYFERHACFETCLRYQMLVSLAKLASGISPLLGFGCNCASKFANGCGVTASPYVLAKTYSSRSSKNSPHGFYVQLCKCLTVCILLLPKIKWKANLCKHAPC